METILLRPTLTILVEVPAHQEESRLRHVAGRVTLHAPVHDVQLNIVVWGLLQHEGVGVALNWSVA